MLSYQIVMVSTRLSGQDTNWVTTNKPFLERLRTYLMHWRNLGLAQQNFYARAYAAGPVLPAREQPQTA